MNPLTRIPKTARAWLYPVLGVLIVAELATSAALEKTGHGVPTWLVGLMAATGVVSSATHFTASANLTAAGTVTADAVLDAIDAVHTDVAAVKAAAATAPVPPTADEVATAVAAKVKPAKKAPAKKAAAPST